MRRDPAQCVIEAGGLGYLLHVSLTTYEALPAPGEHTQLFLHPVIREDEWRLFGSSASRAPRSAKCSAHC